MPKPPKEKKPRKSTSAVKRTQSAKKASTKKSTVKPDEDNKSIIQSEESSQGKAAAIAQTNKRLEAMKARILFNQKNKVAADAEPSQRPDTMKMDFEMKPVRTTPVKS